MEVIKRDIWEFHEEGYPICITTNGYVKIKTSECVMGRGIALQAKQKYSSLPYLIGDAVLRLGNRVHYFEGFNLFSFPVKHNWWEKADPILIEESLYSLIGHVSTSKIDKVFLPKPGCHNGKLDWKTQVEYIFDRHLKNNNKIFVCDLN